jgi:ATPase subunit of ABC transporter with duplicated ATPase domains
LPLAEQHFGDLVYSRGERFNKALSAALADNPDLLLIDEPTNHLDVENKRSLIRKLQNFDGMLSS